jgi:Ferritin-like
MPTDAEAKDLLIDLLREAAGLEHSLLSAYLYAGCALKSTPAEFSVADRPNVRRAQQFERTRAWKQTLFGVAQEEMRHLHFVQCLLRALGERPSFVLPRRNEDGVWHVGGWRAKTGAAESRGVDIPVEPLSDSTVRRFVLYEASDSLQVADPFGNEMRARYRQLADLEFNLRLEAILLNANDQQRASLGPELRRVYSEVAAITPLHVAAFAEAVALPTIEDIRFQSIADLYYSGILPLYEQAFELGWVTENNRDLINEILDPRYAAEGFLPIGPIKRPGNFETIAGRNDSNPLRHYLNVYDIVQEIVKEGEGFSAFEQQSAELLTVVERVGARGYLNALLLAKRPNAKLPDWVVRGELLRNSHLYRFAVMLSEIEREHELGGADFKPARTPIDVARNAGLADFTQQLPAQFNACYLVLVAWLSRIYELTHWTADMRRREAIEMLATWPLMSLAIRPFLEIASLLPVSIKQLFRLEASAMPLLPVVSVQLLAEYLEPLRSETGNARMDYLALRTLTGVASWAGRQQEVVATATLAPHTKQLLMSRLRALAKLSEFEKQFPFRVAGGYSNRPPNELERRPPNAEEARFAEDPAALKPLFGESLVLRLRFAGRGLVQLATDPDPPSDEAGCSGTHMLHAADGDMRAFDRSLIWQRGLTAKSITREPKGALPPVSVNCVDAALMGTAAVERRSPNIRHSAKPRRLRSQRAAESRQREAGAARVGYTHHAAAKRRTVALSGR